MDMICTDIDAINHNFGEIRIDSHNSLPTEKILAFHNVIILIKSVINKNKNKYFYSFQKKARIKINLIHNIFE